MSRTGRSFAISLARVAFDDADLKRLGNLAALEKLNLEGTDISDLGLEQIGRFTSLRELNLSFTSISDRGLVRLGALRKMRRLMMAGTRVTGSGFAALADWKELQELDLTSAPVSDESMPHIARNDRAGASDAELLGRYRRGTSDPLPHCQAGDPGPPGRRTSRMRGCPGSPR